MELRKVEVFGCLSSVLSVCHLSCEQPSAKPQASSRRVGPAAPAVAVLADRSGFTGTITRVSVRDVRRLIHDPMATVLSKIRRRISTFSNDHEEDL